MRVRLRILGELSGLNGHRRKFKSGKKNINIFYAPLKVSCVLGRDDALPGDLALPEQAGELVHYVTH